MSTKKRGAATTPDDMASFGNLGHRLGTLLGSTHDPAFEHVIDKELSSLATELKSLGAPNHAQFLLRELIGGFIAAEEARFPDKS